MRKMLCDRCHKEILLGHFEDVRDFIDEQCPGQDICESCYLQLEMKQAVEKETFLRNTTPKEVLKNWLEVYKKPE